MLHNKQTQAQAQTTADLQNFIVFGMKELWEQGGNLHQGFSFPHHFYLSIFRGKFYLITFSQLCLCVLLCSIPLHEVSRR